ncbi:MFS transporter [Helicobacter sp. 16-1353]|uniref:MFS transporter n=1 Tax=Helicobacter sp. 16-1353 TaxID=2004996 RepID=UPI0015EE6F6C|nr:MFS transporter [Helicobacter sp. 16-1353]
MNENLKKSQNTLGFKDIRYTKIFYFALFSMAAMTVLGSTAIAPSLPNLQAHFKNVDKIEVLSKLVLTMPAIFVVIVSPISGFLFDKFARLKLIFPCIILWSISGVAGFFLDNVYYILISRAIFGIATAFVMTGSSALIADYYKGIRREKALSMQGFFNAFGGALFLVLGGILSNIGWQYPFLVYFLGFVIFILALKYLFEPKRIAQTKPKKQDSSESKLAIESKTTTKDLSNSGFHFWTFFPVYTFGFLGMAMFYIVPTQMPFFIISILHKGGELVGISLAISSIFTAISSLFYARLRQYFRLEYMYCIGFMSMGFGYFLISIFHNYVLLLVGLIFIGAALGILLVSGSSWLFSMTNDYNRAKAFGFLVSAVFMGQFLSPIITQPVTNLVGLIDMFLVFSMFLFVLGVGFLIKGIKGMKKKF